MRLQVIYLEALESPRLFRRKTLNSIQGKKNFDCLVATLVPVPTKADHTAEEQSCKWDTIGVKGAGGIDMILTLLEGLLGGLRVRDDWLEPGGMNPCRTYHRPKVFLNVLRRSGGEDWKTRIA